MSMNPRLLRPTASGFSPRRFSGLEGWWDAADTSTVTQDTGRVAIWADKSGNGRNATNSTSGSTQPTYDTLAVNGKNAVGYLAANNAFLSLNAINIPASYTAISVITRPSSAVRSLTLARNTSTTNDFRYSMIWAADNFLYQWSVAGINFTQHGSASTATGTFVITTRRVGTTSVLVRRNGADVSTVTTGAGVTTAASGFWDCMGFFPPNPMTGRICEVILYSRDLNNAEIELLEQYLAPKWGISL